MTLSVPPAEAETAPRAGLSLPFDIITAPKRAFAKVAATKEWLPAYGVIFVASLATTALLAPALLHIAAVAPPLPGQTKPHTPAQIADAQRTLIETQALLEATIPLLLIMLTASALTTVARFKGQATPYVTFVALAANCMIPSIIGGLLSSLVIRLHDPASFNNMRSILVAVPTNLGVFAAAGNERELSFLSRFDIFDIWSYVLLAFGFAQLTQIKFATALIVAFGLDFLFALMF